MIIGIGTDIVQIARIERSLARFGEDFVARVLATAEMEAVTSRQFSARFVAKRFAAKEAAAKALGTGFSQGVSWQHIHISNDVLGAPQLHFSGRAAELAAQKGIKRHSLSISDERDYAIAFVVLSA